MTKRELEGLKQLFEEEISRRKRINELLSRQEVKELLELSKISIEKQDIQNFREILSLILQGYKITHTNKIYVCIDAYYLHDVGYNHPEYEPSSTSIDSEYSEFKTYKDIESERMVRAIRDKKLDDKKISIVDFENNNVILNPYNENSMRYPYNGYDEVRLEFFENCFTYGQPMSLKMIKMKYPKI